MLREFFQSWELFSQAYLAGWGIALLLSLLGVVVIARNQIFIGVAVSQSSTFGVALALWTADFLRLTLHSDLLLAAVAVAFAVLGVFITGGSGGNEKRTNYEALTGWVYLSAASLSILLLAHSPHGQAEIQRILSSSIIGATTREALLFLAFFGGAAVVVWRWHRALLLVSLDPIAAAASGLRPAWWSYGINVVLGFAIGLSIPVSGMLYTFGCLVLPPLVAKHLCRQTATMFLASPLIALVVSGAAFVLANFYDYPPAQMAVGLLSVIVGLLMAFSGALARISKRGV